MPFSFIMQTSVKAEWLIIVPDFVDTLNDILQSKTNTFLLFNSHFEYEFLQIATFSNCGNIWATKLPVSNAT